MVMQRLDHLVMDIHIAPEEYMKLYEGSAKNVNGVARNGKRVSFPANILRPYVTREGVHGVFAIYFDLAMKFKGIDRLE